jgi:hypothetical protein
LAAILHALLINILKTITRFNQICVTEHRTNAELGSKCKLSFIKLWLSQHVYMDVTLGCEEKPRKDTKSKIKFLRAMCGFRLNISPR